MCSTPFLRRGTLPSASAVKQQLRYLFSEEKFMKHKLIAVFAAVAMCAGLLSACAPGTDKASYELWGTYNTTKVIGQTYKNDTYAKLDASLSIEMMKGEYESAQLIVTFNKGSGKVSLQKGTLTDDKGHSIPDDAVNIYRQMYLQISRNYNGGTTFGAGDYIPDMLLPEQTAIEFGQDGYTAGTNQGFTVEVCSDNLAAGVYSGNFVLDVDGKKTNIPVSVTVWDIELEGKSEFMSSFLIYREYMAYGEYRNDKQITDNYVDFLTRYNVDSYVVRDNYEAERFSESLQKYKENKRMTSIVIPVDFQLNYVPSASNAQFNEAINYITELALNSTDEWCLVEHAYFYPSTYDEADIVPERVAKAEEFFAENGLYFQTLDAAVKKLQTNAEYNKKSESLRLRIEKAIRNIPAVFTNVGYVGEWVKNLTDATFCPYISIYDNYAILQRYQDQAQGVNGNLWAYSCNATNYPYPTLDIDDVSVGIRANGWINMAYGINGYLYWSVNKYYSNIEDSPNAHVNPYKDAYRGGESNGDGWLLYPGSYYDSEYPFASLRLCAYRDGVDDYNMLTVYKRKLQSIADKYGIEIDFNEYVSDLYEKLFSGAVVRENIDGVLYEARRELAKRILALDNDDNLLITKLLGDGALTVSVYSTKDNVKIDGNSANKTVAGIGYKYTTVSDGNMHSYEINTGLRKVNYKVSASVTLSHALANLSEGSSYDSLTDKFRIKAIDGELMDLYRPYIRFGVNNLRKATKMYFTYDNYGADEVELRIRLINKDGTKTEVSTNYCKAKSARRAEITFAEDIVWNNVSSIEISFDNVIYNGKTYVLAPDRSIGLSDLWLDVE